MSTKGQVRKCEVTSGIRVTRPSQTRCHPDSPRFIPRAEEPVLSEAEGISVSLAVERQPAAPGSEKVQECEVRRVKLRV
jgi:hypothetical protein